MLEKNSDENTEMAPSKHNFVINISWATKELYNARYDSGTNSPFTMEYKTRQTMYV